MVRNHFRMIWLQLHNKQKLIVHYLTKRQNWLFYLSFLYVVKRETESELELLNGWTVSWWNHLIFEIIKLVPSQARKNFNFFFSEAAFANWYVDLIFYVLFHSRLFRNYNQIFCTMRNITILMCRSSSLKCNLNIFNLRSSFISFYFNCEWVIKSWINF